MSKRPKLVILGGGFGGLRLLYQLHRIADLTLVDPRPDSLNKPSLPEVALAGRPVSRTRFPLARPVRSHGARLLTAAAERIDPQAHTVRLDNGQVLEYDYLAVAVGAVKDYAAVPGLEEHGYSVCDDQHAPRLWRAFRAFRGGPVVTGSAPSAWGTRIEVPALLAACEGPIGEVAFMAHRELDRRHLPHRVEVFSPAEIFFEDVGPRVHAAVEPLLTRAGISVHTSKRLVEVGADHLRFDDGSTLESALSVIIPPYKGPEVVRQSGLGDEAGFLPVDRSMRFLDNPDIFGVGDASALSMPKLGHIAAHQADIAAAALRQEILGEARMPAYEPKVFCIMNRGGIDATLILSDYLYGGGRDIAKSGPLAHLLKWSFDLWTFHSSGHLPPDPMQSALELLLRA